MKNKKHINYVCVILRLYLLILKINHGLNKCLECNKKKNIFGIENRTSGFERVDKFIMRY